jgi:hypothetical protein
VLVRTNGAAHDQARHQGQAGQEKTKEEQAQEQEEWEFRPARVPDGISLRNFGIQVVRTSFEIFGFGFIGFVSYLWGLGVLAESRNEGNDDASLSPSSAFPHPAVPPPFLPPLPFSFLLFFIQ